MLGQKTKLETLVLSQGQTWVAAFFPRPGEVFPEGTTAECLISDPAGNPIATWEPAMVTPLRIDFIVAADDTDPIPHGSYFRVTVHRPAAGARPAIDENLSRGSVVRDDNPTPLAGPRTANIALSFNDSISGDSPSPNWIKTGGLGNLKVWDNDLFGLPNGLAGDFLLFQSTAARYRAQTNQNAVKVEVGTIVGGFAGGGKTTVIVASNQAMTSWVGMQFATGPLAGAKKLNLVLGSGPTAYEIKSQTANTVADNDRYTYIYDDLADAYHIYKGTDFSAPLLSWPDEGHVVPHGNGYRYPALLFESALLTTGVQLSSWAIKDN